MVYISDCSLRPLHTVLCNLYVCLGLKPYVGHFDTIVTPSSLGVLSQTKCRECLIAAWFNAPGSQRDKNTCTRDREVSLPLAKLGVRKQLQEMQQRVTFGMCLIFRSRRTSCVEQDAF